jgi:hypothetical protein
MDENNNIVMVMGPPSAGKSVSLMNLREPEGVVYASCDLKPLPFKSKFKEIKIVDPLDILNLLDEVEDMEDVHTVVLDTLTFLMDLYETLYVITATDGRAAWGNYAQFYKSFIHKIKSSSKNIVILAHEKKVMNESEMVLETKVPIKGSVGSLGVEADFTTIIAAKKIPVKKLKDYNNNLLHISEREEELGIKHVFQTYVDKNTINEKMRSAMALWEDSEKYIDNDIQNVLDRLGEYYK